MNTKEKIEEYQHIKLPVEMVDTILDIFKTRDVIEFNFKDLTLKTYRKNDGNKKR